MYIENLEAIRDDLNEALNKNSWEDVEEIIEMINKIINELIKSSSIFPEEIPIIKPTDQDRIGVYKSIYALDKSIKNENNELIEEVLKPMSIRTLEETSKLLKNNKIRVNHKQNEIGRNSQGYNGK